MIIKKFPAVPVGHRQHLHEGHCHFIHGHSLEIEMAFTAKSLDSRGFIIDFGAMDYPKQLLKDMDHAMLVAASDVALVEPIVRNDARFAPLFKPLIIPAPSIEGIGWWLFSCVAEWLKIASEGRIELVHISITEDGRNTVIASIGHVMQFDVWLQTHYGQKQVELFRKAIKDSVASFVGERGAYLNG